MKKYVKMLLILFLFSVLFVFPNNIIAEYSGTGGTGSTNVGTTGGSGAWVSYFGFYITVYDQNDVKQGNTIDVYAGSYTSMGALAGWVTNSNGWQVNPEVLYNYLNIPYGSTSGDYSELLSKINTELSIGDYIVIEPYTLINNKKYTFRGIIDSNDIYTKTTCTTTTETQTVCVKEDYQTKQEKYCSSYKKEKKCRNECNEECYDESYEECTGWWIFKSCETKTREVCENVCREVCSLVQTSDCISWSTRNVIDYSKPKICVEFKNVSEEKETCTSENFAYYSWYGKPARILANAAKVGHDITAGGKTFTAGTTCTSDLYNGKNFCGYSSNKNVGYGITVVRYEDIYKNGEVKINIKRNDTKNLILTKNAKFRIYDSSNNKVADITTSSGSAKYSLEEGTYRIEEISSPQGYNLTSSKSVSINIVKSEVTEQDFYYDTNCEVKLDELGSNPSPEDLMNLYKSYPNSTDLLDFNDPSCNPATCDKDNLENTLSCLSGEDTISSTFNDNNLSCYDDAITDAFGNYIGFCSNYFKLTNNLGTSNFYGISGQFLIRQNNNTLTIYDKNLNPVSINSQYVATSKSGKICYVLNGNTYDISSDMKSNIVYFGDVDGNSIADSLNSASIENLNTKQELDKFTKYTYEHIYNYKLSKAIYLEKITGKYSSIKTNKTTEDAIYGILSKFNSSNGYIPFSISYDGNVYSSNKCVYKTTQEIIKYDKTLAGKLDLEFRSIDTSEPFLNRNTNTNWCDGTNCDNNNNIVNDVILNSNNSYNQSGTGPKYKITLTPSDIEIIRGYNDTPYDNYLTKEVLYKGNKIVRNSFLYSLEQGKLNGKNLSNSLFNLKYQ